MNDTNLDQYYKSFSDCHRILKNDKYFILFVSIKNLPMFFINNPFEYKWQYIFYINNSMYRGGLGRWLYYRVDRRIDSWSK